MINVNQCPHEDRITYGTLEQEDGQAFYNVHCETCGAVGQIFLAEDSEKWTKEAISQEDFWNRQEPERFQAVLAKNNIAREIRQQLTGGMASFSYVIHLLEELEKFTGQANQPSVNSIINSKLNI